MKKKEKERYIQIESEGIEKDTAHKQKQKESWGGSIHIKQSRL